MILWWSSGRISRSKQPGGHAGADVGHLLAEGNAGPAELLAQTLARLLFGQGGLPSCALDDLLPLLFGCGSRFLYDVPPLCPQVGQLPLALPDQLLRLVSALGGLLQPRAHPQAPLVQEREQRVPEESIENQQQDAEVQALHDQRVVDVDDGALLDEHVQQRAHFLVGQFGGAYVLGVGGPGPLAHLVQALLDVRDDVLRIQRLRLDHEVGYHGAHRDGVEHADDYQPCLGALLHGRSLALGLTRPVSGHGCPPAAQRPNRKISSSAITSE